VPSRPAWTTSDILQQDAAIAAYEAGRAGSINTGGARISL
jgi:hypothetical protein